MAKEKAKELPEYGTITKRGVEYFRTRLKDADGKWILLYVRTREELYDKVKETRRRIDNERFRRNNPTVEEYCKNGCRCDLLPCGQRQ